MAANYSLLEVAHTTEVTNGLQGTSTMSQTPVCCAHDDSGPILDYEPTLSVPCNYVITGPSVR